MGREGVTIKEVAEAAGVARSTVSRAFNRPGMLNPGTVERIRAAAERLGYVPNQFARSLSTGRYGNLAMIVPNVANPFFPPMIRAAQEEADAHDLCVFLGSSNEDAGQERRLADRFIGQAQGLVLASPRMAEASILELAALRPVVLINRDIAGIPRILIDSSSGTRQAIEYLGGLGHRRFAYLAGPSASWSNQSRQAAVLGEAAARGFEVAVIEVGIPSFEAGRAVAPDVVGTGATAAFVFDDLTGHGLLAGLAELGVRVPQDLAVVGCDDVMGGRTTPSLTSISGPTAEAGRMAVTLLRDSVAAGLPSDRRVVLSTRLVVRASSG